VKKVLVVLGVLIALLVIVIAIVPFVFDANRYRPEIESRLSQSLERDVKIGNLQLSIFSGGVTANNITIAENPAYGTQPFVQAKELKVGVDLWPLIFSKQLKIESLVLQAPDVRLLQSAKGKWNFSTLGSNAGQPAAARSSAETSKPASGTASAGTSNRSGGSANELSINKLEVSNGRIIVGDANGKQESYTDLNLKASDISNSSSFPFTLSLAAPQGGKVSIDGKAGPLAANDLSATPFSGDVTIDNFDLAATGFVSPQSGLAGILNYKGKVNSDGKTVQAEGNATASKLRLVKGGTAASQPIQVDYHSSYNLASQSGNVNNTTIHTGKSTAAISGTYDAHGATTNINMNLVANQMATGDIQGLLPALGVVLPAGSALQGGTVSANLDARGPSDALVTTGILDISNAKLAGFSMGKGLSSIAALAGLQSGGDTTIQLLKSNLRIAPDGMQFSNIDLVVPEIGSMTGSGTIGASSALDFHLIAKLNGASASGTPNAVGMLTSALGGKTGLNLKQIPIHITGTTSKPVFVPDVGSAVAQQLIPGKAGATQQNNPVGGLINGLFGGKKKP
jgi:AsmA protein